VLERTPELQHTETLVMETTFLDDRVTVESARSSGHIHLDEVLQRADLLPRGEVVMSHFSARYTDQEVRRIVSERLPDDLRGVVKLFGVGDSSGQA